MSIQGVKKEVKVVVRNLPHSSFNLSMKIILIQFHTSLNFLLTFHSSILRPFSFFLFSYNQPNTHTTPYKKKIKNKRKSQKRPLKG